MAEKDRNQRWYRTNKLRIGQRVNKFISPWQVDTSYEAGWLSGFISGEGSLKGANCRVDAISFCQRPGRTLDKAIGYCNKLSLPITTPYGKRGGIGKGDALYVDTRGGKWRTIEIIGRLQINRFLDKIDWSKFGGLNGIDKPSTPRRTSVIVNIEDVGVKDVAIISTTEKTYIANGYPMHNCNRFDIPKAQTRFLINKLAPPSPFRTIDTLKVAQQNFRFASNKLDYIGELLLHDRKLHTEYQLWLRCLDGDPKSLEEMLTYNKKDVLLVEEAYVFLRPFIKSHPNMAIYQEAIEPTCPTCGSVDIEECGHYSTSVNRYLAFRCKDCGAICRSRKIDTPLKSKSAIMMPTAR
jgi:hypothetical protein